MGSRRNSSYMQHMNQGARESERREHRASKQQTNRPGSKSRPGQLPTSGSHVRATNSQKANPALAIQIGKGLQNFPVKYMGESKTTTNKKLISSQKPRIG